MAEFKVLIQKESYKFSSAHFTVFGPQSAERLHGHNYSVTVEVAVNALDATGMAFDFNSLKPFIKKSADLWDEFVLVPLRNPHIQLSSEAINSVPHTVLGYCGKSYRFPDSDVVKLDVVNITSEELARHFLTNLVQGWLSAEKPDAVLKLRQRLKWVEVGIEETRGQRASFRQVYSENVEPGK